MDGTYTGVYKGKSANIREALLLFGSSTCVWRPVLQETWKKLVVKYLLWWSSHARSLECSLVCCSHDGEILDRCALYVCRLRPEIDLAWSTQYLWCPHCRRLQALRHKCSWHTISLCSRWDSNFMLCVLHCLSFFMQVSNSSETWILNLVKPCTSFSVQLQTLSRIQVLQLRSDNAKKG